MKKIIIEVPDYIDENYIKNLINNSIGEHIKYNRQQNYNYNKHNKNTNNKVWRLIDTYESTSYNGYCVDIDTYYTVTNGVQTKNINEYEYSIMKMEGLI